MCKQNFSRLLRWQPQVDDLPASSDDERDDDHDGNDVADSSASEVDLTDPDMGPLLDAMQHINEIGQQGTRDTEDRQSSSDSRHHPLHPLLAVPLPQERLAQIEAAYTMQSTWRPKRRGEQHRWTILYNSQQGRPVHKVSRARKPSENRFNSVQ